MINVADEDNFQALRFRGEDASMPDVECWLAGCNLWSVDCLRCMDGNWCSSFIIR